MNESTINRLSAGDMIGDFTIVSYIGRGGYGDVYYVSDTLGKRFVLKLLHEEYSLSSEREIQGISLLRKQIHASEHLPLIYYVGKYANHIYYTMDAADNYNGISEDYCPDTLERRLQDGEQFSFEEILDMLLSLLTSINILHQNNIVHRDIKPANIIRFAGKWRLTDFGLLSSAPKTFVGSLGFLAPYPDGGPNIQNEKEGDLYSLGKVLYCVFSGEPVDRYPILSAKYPVRDAAAISKLYHKACSCSSKQRFHSCEEFKMAVFETINQRKKKTINQKNLFIAISVALVLFFGTVFICRFKGSLPNKDSEQSTSTTLQEDDNNDQEGFLKIFDRGEEYEILCCFPREGEQDGDPLARENQYKAMGMVKSGMSYYLKVPDGQVLKIKHIVYLRDPFSEKSLLVYMYSIRHADCIFQEKE